MPKVKDNEVKFAITKEGQGLVVDKLVPIDGVIEEYTLHFFDTDELALFEKGLILRARHVMAGPPTETDDVTCKRRGPDAEAAAIAYGAGAGKRKLEWDINVGGERKRSFSITSAPLVPIAAVLADGTRLREAFEANAGDMLAAGGFSWEGLLGIGPISARKWKARIPDWEGKVTVENWTTTNGTTLLEVSDKVEAAEVDAFTSALVKHLNYDLKVAQFPDSKTRFALENSRKFALSASPPSCHENC